MHLLNCKFGTRSAGIYHVVEENIFLSAEEAKSLLFQTIPSADAIRDTIKRGNGSENLTSLYSAAYPMQLLLGDLPRNWQFL